MQLLSFPNSRSRQRTAVVMLLLWLFALASGVANACLLEGPGSHAPATAAHGTAPSHTGHPDDADQPNAACLKACDDGSQALAKQTPAATPCDPGPAPIVAIIWVADTLPARLLRGVADPPPALPQAPLRVLYSRWTS